MYSNRDEAFGQVYTPAHENPSTYCSVCRVYTLVARARLSSCSLGAGQVILLRTPYGMSSAGRAGWRRFEQTDQTGLKTTLCRLWVLLPGSSSVCRWPLSLASLDRMSIAHLGRHLQAGQVCFVFSPAQSLFYDYCNLVRLESSRELTQAAVKVVCLFNNPHTHTHTHTIVSVRVCRCAKGHVW
ncbi:unnamed protein product [Protopolystoma xenopodis]|uniref:Uncharacterized protein n=1 Tax=Protopolystoma xenopodis TaxID=117903 RepID=A0A448XQ84_9PLAT|nr:unnamed protein product [Protopolystoma xenopodis]